MSIYDVHYAAKREAIRHAVLDILREPVFLSPEDQRYRINGLVVIHKAEQITKLIMNEDI
jgi:hypothetical protein